MPTLTAALYETVVLQPNQSFTVTSDSASTGHVARLPDRAGDSLNAGITEILASNSKKFGPFSQVTRFQVFCATGSLTISAPVNDSGIIMPGFTAEQIAAMAKTPIFSAKNIPIRTSLPVPAGFDYNNGWAIVRFIAGTMDGANQYLWTVCNGSNEQHGQIINTASKVQGRTVVGGVSKDNSTPSFYVIKAGEHIVAGFSWRSDGYQYSSTLSGDSNDIYGSRQDFNDMTITMPRSSGGTELRIGSRNSNSEDFNGPQIESVEIGNEYLNEAQLYARMKQVARSPIVLVGIGQSLAKGFFTNEVDNLGTAREKFMEQLISEMGGSPVIATINTSQGGTSLMKIHDAGSGFWWDETTGTYGPKGTNMQAQLSRLGQSPAYFFHAFGETDSVYLDTAGRGTAAQFESALRAFYAKLHNDYPTATILVNLIGRRAATYGGEAQSGVQKIREIQKRVIEDLPYVSKFVETFDIALHTDNTHWSSAGCTTAGQRMGKRFANLLGKVSNGALGPRVTGVVRSGTGLTITITHDIGTDFVPTTAIQGFRYFDTNGNEIALSNVVRATATTITATLASGVAGTLYYGHDACTYITDVTKIVVDNAAVPMPLQTYKGSVA